MSSFLSGIRGAHNTGVPGSEAKREVFASYKGKKVTRCLRYLVCGVSVSLAAPAVSAYPILFYSDLDSGPVGAYVTVWGKGFGTPRRAW